MGERSRPCCTRLVEFVAVVGDARTGAAERETGPDHAGQADLGQHFRASRRLPIVSPRGTSKPIRSMAALNSLRDSAFAIASAEAPINPTPYFSNTPCRTRSMARFNPVCPPRVGSKTSGRSRSITLATISQVNGSMYVRSAISGSVMIVAGLELTSTTS